MTRALVGIVAVLTVAWFAVGVRQAHDTDVASNIVAGAAPISPARARHATALLHDATQLNPDTAVDLLRAQLALRQGQPARARAIALSVTRSEPQNLQAWLTYGTASAADPPAFRLALARVRQLAPPVGGSGQP